MMVSVKVLRAFLIGGKRQEIGTVVEVGNALAAELVYNGKAERAGAVEVIAAADTAADQRPKRQRKAMTTQSATALVAGAAQIQEVHDVQ